MNVFDFDGTIYHGDSSKDFFFYCLKHYPRTRSRIFPIIWYGIGFGLRIVKKKSFKQKLFSIVTKIDDLQGAVLAFWEENKHKIHKWYLEMKQPTDVIISASPEFLLEPICKQLGAECMMATRVDEETGLFHGENCHGQEKVRRFFEKYPDGEIDEFYSDMYCDTPLARLAKRAYIVKGEKLSDWKKFK
ncbi:MAG: haloacid dehalogenase-like hydrolase [Clostridia bacterium]|nr:haloacid dehalogenase-like hydrolase [Clostridia bacterium]